MSESLACPVCEYPHARRVWEISDRIFQTTDEVFALYRCPACKMIFQDENEVKDRLSEFYPSGYWWQERGSTGRLERSYREWMIEHDQLKFVRESLGSSFQGRVLDIGCGSGTFVKVARGAGLDAYGLEVSAEAADLASREVPDRIFRGSEQELAAAGEEFDAITLFHSLEHVPQPFKYLKGLHKLIRRPGIIIIQVPNCQSLQARLLGSRWYGLDCPRHLYNYSNFAILHLLGRAGYRIKRTHQFSLRDNACCLVSSLFPGLDPMAGRVRAQSRGEVQNGVFAASTGLVYLSLMLMAQPFARLEAALGYGASLLIAASLD